MSPQFRGVALELRRARKARGLSQEELSKQLGIGQGTLSRAETTTDIQFGTLQQIARALDLEPMLVPRRLVPVVDAVLQHGMSGVAEPDDDEAYDEAYDEPGGKSG
ncbi:MAG: helix-turn-helix transcriptional regulator [Candidatus Eremiobacteraeota bacterium]|nr:helix-turn-helix transcriptional regulator [Candidatus Eremiobacteraeota bacterium]